MAPRPITPIDRVPLVGGHACLDFVNTTGARAGGAPRERLTTFADLVVFGRRTGLLPAAAAAELEARAHARPREAEDTLASVRALRELIYRVLLAALRAEAPDPADLRALNHEHQHAGQHRVLAWSAQAPTWEIAPQVDALQALRDLLVLATVELLVSPERARLAKCGECDWLFLDTSKNRGRRWCKKTCGDRVKSRRYYERTRATDGGEAISASRPS